jgi:hypothetical protein
MSRRRRFLLTWIVFVCSLAGLGIGTHWYVNSTYPAGLRPSARDDPSTQDAPALTLSEEEREYLWELEHHGNVLSRRGFKILADALRRGDAAALSALLSSDFTGEMAKQPRQVRLDADFAQVVRKDDSGEPQRLDRSQFIERLLGYRRAFARPPQIKLALMGLAPTTRLDLDSPWQGSCQLRMWGEAVAGQPSEVVLYLQYRLPRPTAEVFKKSGWLRSCTIRQSQEGRASRFLLREVTAERGIDAGRFHDNWTCDTEVAGNQALGHQHDNRTSGKGGQPAIPVTGGVFLCDYDRDGFLDMLIVDIRGHVLYRGRPGGKFEDVTTRVGLPSPAPTHDLLAMFADLDGDGWEDLLLDGHFYRNEKGQHFEDVTSRTNLVMPSYATNVIVADYDRDGRLDVYVTRGGMAKVDSWIEGKNGSRNGNVLFRNLGDWKFRNVTAESGADGDRRSTFSAVWFDADNDGWPDLYVINEFGNGVLLHNEGNGRFRKESLVNGAGDFGSMGVTCGDIDNDGRIDLYVANMYSKAGNRIIGNLRPDTYEPEVMARLRSLVAGSQLYLNRGGLRFEPVGPKFQVSAIGWAYGAALMDLDNDGWLDLYATCGFVSKSHNEPDG